MSGNNANAVTLIKDLKPGLNSLTLQFIVLEIPRPTTTKDNQVAAKSTGFIRIMYKQSIIGSEDSEGGRQDRDGEPHSLE